LSRKLEGKKMLVLPDQHYAPESCTEGGVDPGAEACVLKAIEIVKPDIFVNIGDAGEFNSVCHFKYKRVKRPPLNYQLKELDIDAAAVNAGLDKFDEALAKVGCKEKHFCEGNHCCWLDNLCLEYEHLKKDYSPPALLKLKERGFKYHPYGKYIKFGKLAVYHGGHYVGIYHAHKHAVGLGHSVMYAHTHDQQTAKVATLDSYHGAWSIGSICKANKPFLKGRPTNWSHNFAIIHFREGGKFNVEIVEIFEGVCYLWGNKVTA
jgi:hypothetical protein